MMPAMRRTLGVAEGSALAIAQSLMCRAIDRSGVRKRIIAQRLRRPQKYLTEILRGDYDGLTIKELARVLHVCGWRLEMNIERRRRRVKEDAC